MNESEKARLQIMENGILTRLENIGNQIATGKTTTALNNIEETKQFVTKQAAKTKNAEKKEVLK